MVRQYATLTFTAACLVLTQGCAQGDGAGAAPTATAQPQINGVLPVREQVVAAADALALAATQAPKAEAPGLFVEAARLRARLWRLEHKEADVLEALELYDKATKAGARDCATQLDAIVLKGQKDADPAATTGALEQLEREASARGCREKVALALATLAAFPAPSQSSSVSAGVLAASAAASADLPPALDVPTTPQATTISRVEHYGAPTSARIVILMSRPSVFEVGELPRRGTLGPRLYVDILGASFEGPGEYEVGGLVQRVRLGQHGGGVRAVLDLKSQVVRRVFYLPEPFRLVLDVSAAEHEGPESKALRRVVLDPGHGGHDPGAIGASGLREKDVALDVAHRAAPLIARELGVSALLTRDGDTFVPLDERVARANAFGADLFISIHCNSSESNSPRGVMTFVLDASPDRIASSIAARENDASEAAAAELATAMSRMLDARSVARSTHFAGLLQRSAMASLSPYYPDVPSGGVRRAGFYVLAGARMPAVLFEGSFISNPVDELRLDSADYRQKLADAIVNAVRAYRDDFNGP